MAVSYTNVGIPVDQPAQLKQGVRYRETDDPGNAKWQALPPEDPIRARKGDLGLAVIPGFGPKNPKPFALKEK